MTYLLPICDLNNCWIEKIIAKGFNDAEEKAVKILADDYEFIDYSDSYKEACETAFQHNIILGDLYDIEEF